MRSIERVAAGAAGSALWLGLLILTQFNPIVVGAGLVVALTII
jgi:hypothetical protein